MSVADIVAGEREFVAYWTIGGGTGKRRSHWARKLREDLRRKAEQGRLLGLGGTSGASLDPAAAARRKAADDAFQRRVEAEKAALEEEGARVLAAANGETTVGGVVASVVRSIGRKGSARA